MTQPNPDPPSDPFEGQDEYPDPAELTQYFLSQFQDRVTGLEEAWDEGDLRAVRRLAEELRGDADACAFGDVCEEAWRIETELLEEAALSALSEKIEDLLTLCRQSNSRRTQL